VTTVAELLVGEELEHLVAIANARAWPIEVQQLLRFRIGLPAKDGQMFWLSVELDRYLEQPAAFHWSDAGGDRLDDPRDTPKGGTFFHGSGRICAPWNRLAYSSVDPKGPHGDWQLAGWRNNPNTKGTKTLAAMVLRIHHELQSAYEGRLG
jgi:hypothetical protein